MESVGEPPAPNHRLDLQSVAGAPSSAGVYAAWIVDERALDAAGIDGPPPVLVYVGRASGASGLRARLARHARSAWWELIDLLASRRTVLPAWWSHAQQNTTRRTLVIPPLAALAEDEARSWQHEQLRWGWSTLPAPQTGPLEQALIAVHRPLLNRHGKGYAVLAPPQLRAGDSYEPARAWWLFHVAWIAVLTLRPRGWARRSGRECVVAVDQRGWPVALGEGIEHSVRIPSERAARRTLMQAAPRTLRDALTHWTSADEALAWWAAYAGHACLEQPSSAQDALRAALARDDAGHAAPDVLPPVSHRQPLVAMLGALPRVTH